MLSVTGNVVIMFPSLGNISRSARKWKYVIRQGFSFSRITIGWVLCNDVRIKGQR